MTIGSGCIQFNLFWQGEYSYRGCAIRDLKIEMSDAKQEIIARINSCLPSTQKQRLNFEIGDKTWGGDVIHKRDTRKIDCPIDLAKTMEINVSISNGSNFKMIPVKFVSLPACFKENKKYQIKVSHNDNELRAHILRKWSIADVEELTMEGKFFQAFEIIRNAQKASLETKILKYKNLYKNCLATNRHPIQAFIILDEIPDDDPDKFDWLGDIQLQFVSKLLNLLASYPDSKNESEKKVEYMAKLMQLDIQTLKSHLTVSQSKIQKLQSIYQNSFQTDNEEFINKALERYVLEKENHLIIRAAITQKEGN